MNGPFVLGAFGMASIVAALTVGRRSWRGAALLGLGLGALYYVTMLTFTDDPIGFVHDFFSLAVG